MDNARTGQDSAWFAFRGLSRDEGRAGLLESGPIFIVPGDGGPLSVAYTLYNQGGTLFDEVTRERRAIFPDRLAQATGHLANAMGLGGSPAVVRLSSELSDHFAGCDGPVAVGLIALRGAELDAQSALRATAGVGGFSGPDYHSQVGCGATSQYSVNLHIRRGGAARELVIAPAATLAVPGATVRFSAPNSAAVDWNVETPGGGSIVGGVYHAPEQFPPNQLVVIRATERVASFGAVETPRTAIAFVDLQEMAPTPEQGGATSPRAATSAVRRSAARKRP